MGRKFWIVAILVPILCCFLLKYQDADFILMMYEIIGQDPATALRGKVVWITGASSGIGEYLAYELAKYGCKLVLSARRKTELERVKENCAAIATGLNSSFEKDQDILVLPLDLLKHDTHGNLTQDVLKHFGKVDILVNNGGRFQKSWIRKTPLEVDKAVFDLNVFGTISLTKAVLPHMIEWKQGQIVVVSSVLGKMGVPHSVVYCATKHALQGYFDGVRIELAQHNIHVQTVLPGPVESQVANKAFTEDINIEYKDSPEFIKIDFPVMPTERCARLMAIGMANNLDEIWISQNPMLLATYMRQYFPNLFNWIIKAAMDRMMTSYEAKLSSERHKRRAQET
ncbi:dehydrogenase/reductase SDR family member 7 [Pocillopora verrucosa]|uniref:dehydrogenase/reductase SDR family member 7 n=1 Tax=Pocillopora verrucosa TaxID=203993 RepID=UPI002797B618|nr:dehydrogenase/reductase SDR family member 7-like [Pocillopora verrucosa]